MRHVSAWEEVELLTADLTKAREQIAKWEHALSAVLSALEDVGQENGLAHEIASKALRGA